MNRFPQFILATSPPFRVIPSRCVRCGSASRDFLCPSCVDYLIAYHPLWLNPALLPGPSLLDWVAPRESPLLSVDLGTVEWRALRSEPTSGDAARLVRLLGLDEGEHPILSVGDAEVLHGFLREARRSMPSDPEARQALAATYRYLSTCGWLPSHLASEYRLRANLLGPAGSEPETAAAAAPEPPVPEVVEPAPVPPAPGPIQAEPAPTSVDEEPSEPPAELPEAETDLEDLGFGEEGIDLPAPEPFPPEPLPGPEPPLPMPEPVPGPQPEPEPEPEPEEDIDEERWLELEAMKTALERERAELESASHLRAEAIRAKESSLEQRERSIAAKEREVIAQAQAATERLIALEKDQARLQVLRFLGTVPGMAEAQADVIASAFPDMASLQAADAKALTQCHGVTEALARAVRYELVPGEVEEEQHAIRIREEAQAFLEEGAYQAALDCYDRLLRERPEEIGLWFDRASVLALLDRPAEALDCYQKVVDREPNHRQAWFERANLLFGLGRLSEAIDSLREVLRIAPTKTADIALKAEQLRRDGHPHEAAILYQAIVDANPGDTRSTLGLGDSLLNLGDAEAAEALFSRALGKNPQNAPILFRKGELLDRKGRWGAAIQYYNRAIALQWNFLSPWIAKGSILLDHNRAPEALECFEKVLSFDPKNVEAWAGKARAHAALGDVEAAAKALEQALRQDPQSRSVGRAREAVQGMPPAPPAAPPAAVSRKPVKEQREESLEEPAVVERSEGAKESTEDWTVEPPAAETPPDFKSLIEAFEEIEEESREETEPPRDGPALGADFHSFVESIEPDQEDVQVLVQLAELALEGGDPSMALVRYEQALQKGERNADAWTGKGIALQQLERYREALEAYDRALSLRRDHELAKKWRATVVRHLESEGTR